MAEKPRDLRVDAELTVVNADDDASILFAVIDALKGGPVAGTRVAAPPDPEPKAGGKRVYAKEDIQQPAEDEIAKALDKVTEALKASGREPKFDSAAWVAALQALWNHIAQMEDAGYKVSAEAVE